MGEAAPAKQKRPWYKRPLILIPLALVVLLIVSQLGGGDQQPTGTSTPTETASPAGESPAASPEPEPGFADGTHTVGTDIAPGTYRSDRSGTCYWARLRGFSGELADIIANGNNSPEIVTVADSDAGFDTRGCGRWLPVDDTAPGGPVASFRDATFKVGLHLNAGRYRADGSGTCYWARLRDFSHELAGIIANGNNPTTVQIASGDAGFTTFGCGTWSQA